MSRLSFDTNKHDNAITSQKQEHPGSSGRRRVSRWDSQPKIDGQGGEKDSPSKRRKTRWSDDSQLKMSSPIHLPDFVKKLVEADLDPEVQELKKKLLLINKRILELEATVGRNSSSSPVYDAFGVKIDSGDANFHEKLIQVRQDIIARLIDKNPTFKPPSENKPPKLYKRLYIPARQYPSYNFIGLIIGPRGNTQKRMEKETGARIVLRGKGSRKDRKEHQKPDPSDEEDLHVLIEAENQKSLDDAVGMVEKLLIPVDEGMNEHKRAQLRELADLSGTLRDENLCNCSQVRHMKYACPVMNSVSSCDTCGGSTHSTVNCPLTVSTPSADLANQQKRSFLTDTGGAGGFTFSTPKTSCNNPWQGGNTGFGISPAYGSNFHIGAGSAPTTDGMSSKEVDVNLAVRHLPQTVDDIRLRELFAPFGRLMEAKVIKDQITGSSKGFGFIKYGSSTNAMTAVARMNGYMIDGEALIVKVAEKPYFDFGAGSTPTTDGMSSKEVDHIKLVVCHIPQTVDDVRLRALFAPFGRLIEAKVMKGLTGLSKEKGFVMYDNPSNAMTAVVHMNGYKIDGKALTVKVAEKPSTEVVSSTNRQPWNWAPAMTSQDSVSPTSWPGPPGSMLPDSQFSSSKSHNVGLPQSSVFLGHSDTSSEQFPSSHRVPLSSPSLLQFPGYPDYHKSQHTSYFSPPSNFPPQMHPIPSLSGSISPSPWPPIQPPRNGNFDFP